MRGTKRASDTRVPDDWTRVPCNGHQRHLLPPNLAVNRRYENQPSAVAGILGCSD